MIEEQQFLLLPIWYVAFVLSLTCHEAAHALAAYRGGDSTAYLGGQVSLNPIPHMQREPFGTVLVPLISFFMSGWMMGWASAPYDPAWEDRYPRRAAVMAAAGPLANLLLAVFGFLVLKVGLLQGIWLPQGAELFGIDRLVTPAESVAGIWEGVGRFASILFSLNVILLLFNLLPIPPLDGASILAGLFEPARRLRDALQANTFALLIGILIAWNLISPVLDVVYPPLIRSLYGWS